MPIRSSYDSPPPNQPPQTPKQNKNKTPNKQKQKKKKKKRNDSNCSKALIKFQRKIKHNITTLNKDDYNCVSYKLHQIIIWNYGKKNKLFHSVSMGLKPNMKIYVLIHFEFGKSLLSVTVILVGKESVIRVPASISFLRSGLHEIHEYISSLPTMDK